jgi:hypothetical protein
MLCLPTAAWAILIDTGGSAGRVGGYFVNDDGKKLVIRIDGKEKSFDRSKVKILHEVDRKRLEKLSRENPRAYYDYAEELARQPDDPEARDTAMRLFLIAAYLDRPQYGHRSLLSMTKLAVTPTEARKCRAMAFLLDPKGDDRILQTNPVKPPQADTDRAMQSFLEALRYYRTGQIGFATAAAKRPGTEKIFSMAPGMMDQRDFLQACTDAKCATCGSQLKVKCTTCNGSGTTTSQFGVRERCTVCNGSKLVPCTACEGTGLKPFPDDVMRCIVRAELWAVDHISGAGGKKGARDSYWSSILQSRPAPVSPLSLETITEFDPRKCLYRKGRWVDAESDE